MSALDDIFAENMICATVNAPQSTISVTLRAYLIAHQPDRILAFCFIAPTDEIAEAWSSRLSEKTLRIYGRSSERKLFVADASTSSWVKILDEFGADLERSGMVIEPRRPGSEEARRPPS